MKDKNTKRGFVRLIVILIIILIVLGFLGLDITKVWSEVFLPIFSFIGDLILGIAKWLISILRYVWAAIGI